MRETNNHDKAPLVLIADDDITIRTMAKECLIQTGFRVEEAANGTQALSAFNYFKPDITLLDVMMPEMNGFKVCESIRSLPSGQYAPIVMLTSLDDRESINRAYDAGATDFIAKPINWALLGHRVHYILRASQAFKGLQRSQAKTRALLHAIPDLMFQVSKESRILDYSLGSNSDLIQANGELLNKTIHEVLPEDLARKIMHYAYRALEGVDIFRFEYQYRVQDESRYYELRIVTSGENEALAIIRDLTETKRAEEENKKLEAQFHQAQKLEAIGTLAGGIAHDFNNLLMGIQGQVQLMLLNATPSPPQVESLKKIQAIGKRGVQLTRQLLTFARGGSYEAKVTNINELMEETSQMFARTNKGIRIHKFLQTDAWPVEVDQGQIGQALLNLLVNAEQAMPEGGDLYLQTENLTLDEKYVVPFTLKPGDYVKISVTDTGVGMDTEIKKHLFEPFFTTREKVGGTGLGLASAYGIIKNHSGTITVYSEKGEGATFNIYLPASEKLVATEKIYPEQILKGKETILIVDDEDMIIEVEKSMLDFLGYRVLVAQGGREAIEKYKQHRNDVALVLLDMIMPDLTGKETYEKLRVMNPEVKVLLVSGYSLNNQANEVLKQGCQGFVQKPFTMPHISQRIRQVIENTY